MRKRFLYAAWKSSIALFMGIVLPVSVVAQTDVSPDSVEIKKDIMLDIDFGLHFSTINTPLPSKKESLYNKILPMTYIGDSTVAHLTLLPYDCFTKWNEDPIQGLGPMVSPKAINNFTLYDPVLQRTYVQGTKMKLRRGMKPSGISFSDALQFIFDKSYRQRVYNARHAKAWKHY